MRQLVFIALVSGLASGPALAAEDAPGTNGDGPEFSISVAGGATVVDGADEQPFLRVAVTRFIGEGYIYAAATHFAVGDGFGIVDIVPASTWQATLGAGRKFGDLTLGGYAAIGRRTFKEEEFLRRGGRTITVDSQGNSLSAGISATYQIELDERSALSPFATGDISQIDTARAIEVAGRGTIAQKEKQNSTTASIGLTMDRLLGADGLHRVEAYGAFVTTTNSAVSIRSSAPIEAARLFGPQDFVGFEQSWGEYGLSGIFTLSDTLVLDVSAVRTAGFRGGNSTNVSTGMRYLF